MRKISSKLRHLVSEFASRLPPNHRQGPPPREDSEKLANPKSSEEAHFRLRQILHASRSLTEMSHDDFVSGWVAMAYIAPGLNPDEARHDDGGWPQSWQLVAAEAFRRHQLKMLTDAELYPKSY